MVEIAINKNKKPSKDWLRSVKTSFARSNIRKLTAESESKFKFPIPGFYKKKICRNFRSRKKEKGRIKKL